VGFDNHSSNRRDSGVLLNASTAAETELLLDSHRNLKNLVGQVSIEGDIHSVDEMEVFLEELGGDVHPIKSRREGALFLDVTLEIEGTTEVLEEGSSVVGQLVGVEDVCTTTDSSDANFEVVRNRPTEVMSGIGVSMVPTAARQVSPVESHGDAQLDVVTSTRSIEDVSEFFSLSEAVAAEESRKLLKGHAGGGVLEFVLEEGETRSHVTASLLGDWRSKAHACEASDDLVIACTWVATFGESTNAESEKLRDARAEEKETVLVSTHDLLGPQAQGVEGTSLELASFGKLIDNVSVGGLVVAGGDDGDHDRAVGDGDLVVAGVCAEEGLIVDEGSPDQLDGLRVADLFIDLSLDVGVEFSDGLKHAESVGFVDFLLELRHDRVHQVLVDFTRDDHQRNVVSEDFHHVVGSFTRGNFVERASVALRFEKEELVAETLQEMHAIQEGALVLSESEVAEALHAWSVLELVWIDFSESVGVLEDLESSLDVGTDGDVALSGVLDRVLSFSATTTIVRRSVGRGRKVIDGGTVLGESDWGAEVGGRGVVLGGLEHSRGQLADLLDETECGFVGEVEENLKNTDHRLSCSGARLKEGAGAGACTNFVNDLLAKERSCEDLSLFSTDRAGIHPSGQESEGCAFSNETGGANGDELIRLVVSSFRREASGILGSGLWESAAKHDVGVLVLFLEKKVKI
jgi:hypothetical protein